MTNTQCWLHQWALDLDPSICWKTEIWGETRTEVKSFVYFLTTQVIDLTNVEQHGWQPPAYFPPNYKYFDQLLPLNEATVLNLDSKGFLQTPIPTLISILYAKMGVHHDFPLEFFCFTVPKEIRGEPFGVSENLGHRKILWIRRGVIMIFRWIFLSHSSETFRRGTRLCFRKFLLTRGEGVSQFFVDNFLSQSAETFRRGTLPGFRKILVSEIFVHKRGVSRFSIVLIKLKNVAKGWGSNPYLPLQNFVMLPTVPWEQLEILTNVSEIIKISDTTKIRTRTYCLRNFCPNPTAGIYFGIKKSWENWTEKKKEKRPYWMNNFSCIL